MTRQLRQFGIETLVIDAIFGTDVLTKGMLSKVGEKIRSGRVYACMIEVPCSTFSIAQSRSGVALRLQNEPRGIATNYIARSTRIKLGNDLLDFTIGVIEMCNEFSVLFAMESPQTSYAWHDRKLKTVLREAELIDVHQCGFGARFRKTTRLTFGNFSKW